MARLALSTCRRFLFILPALTVFALVFSVRGETLGQGSPGEPHVLISTDAAAFVDVLQSEISPIAGLSAADVVILYPAPPSGANLIVIDIKAGRKYWTRISLQKLGRIFSRMGDPA